MKTNLLKFFQLTAILLAFFNATAQNYNGQGGGQGGQGGGDGSVSGNVMDSLSAQTVEYANVVLYKAKDNTMVTGGITNEKGNFKIDKVPYGKYNVVVSFMGFNKKTVGNVMVTPKSIDRDLGTIFLVSSSTSLDAVNVVADKKMVEFKVDKKVVNVEKNLSVAGGTAVDVLQNVPSVTVDADGAVSLRGSDNVTILIDGRPSSITGTKLDQIPSSAIESIEVITNPSAKYNPEGMAGILNIVLKKKATRGFNGIATVSAGTGDKYSGSFNFNANFDKMNLFGAVDSRYNHRLGWGSANNQNWQTVNQKVDTTYTNQSSNSTQVSFSNSFKIGADFFLNPKNTLTLSYNFRVNSNKDNPDISSGNTYTSFGPLTNYINGTTENEMEYSSDYTINYKKVFDKKEHVFTADIILNTDRNFNPSNLSKYTDSIYNNKSYNGYQKTNTDLNTYNLTVQANYVHPFNETMKLEVGYQSILRSANNNYEVDTIINNKDSIQQINNFKYTENYNAVYGIFSFDYLTYSFQVGARFEQSTTQGQQLTDNKSFTRHDFQVYPSFSMTKKITDKQDLLFSYSKRVNRPRLEMLNPFVDLSNYPISVRYGNPDLKPEFIQSFELNYSVSFGKSSITTGFFYRHINEVMRRYMFETYDSIKKTSTINMTFVNFSSSENYGYEIMGETALAKWWRINGNANFFRTITNGGDASLNSDSYSWNARINSTMTFWKGFAFQLNTSYRAPMVQPGGKMLQMYSTDIAFKQDLFKGKGSLGFRVSDIFNTMKFHNESWGDGYYLDSWRKRETRIAYLTFTYNIGGGIKAKPRKRDDNGGQDDQQDF